MPSPGITKNMLAATMKELMEEQPLSKISVGEIVARCGLNRNSFYYHFKDKYDLVNWIFYTEFAAAMKDVDFESTWAALEQIYRFFYNDRVFYQNALSITGQDSFSEYFASIMKPVLIVQIESIYEEDEDQEFYAEFVVSAFLLTLSRWLADGAKIPPEKLAELSRKVLTGAAVRIMQDP